MYGTMMGELYDEKDLDAALEELSQDADREDAATMCKELADAENAS